MLSGGNGNDRIEKAVRVATGVRRRRRGHPRQRCRQRRRLRTAGHRHDHLPVSGASVQVVNVVTLPVRLAKGVRVEGSPEFVQRACRPTSTCWQAPPAGRQMLAEFDRTVGRTATASRSASWPTRRTAAPCSDAASAVAPGPIPNSSNDRAGKGEPSVIVITRSTWPSSRRRWSCCSTRCRMPGTPRPAPSSRATYRGSDAQDRSAGVPNSNARRSV